MKMLIHNIQKVQTRILLFSIMLCSLFILTCAQQYKAQKFDKDVQSATPILLEKIKPTYPEEAKKLGIQGKVSLHLLVTKEGRVKIARVAKSSGFKILDDAAIEYGKNLRFIPKQQEGKPINIWVTWRVDYKLESAVAYFDPKKYASKITALYKRAEQSTGLQRKSILNEILIAHDEYVKQLNEDSRLNYNNYIRAFVRSEVYKQWKVFWEDWPLRFAVYHDFILRFPDSAITSHVTERFIKLIIEDIARIKLYARYKQNLYEKKDKYLKSIYNFLDAKYPEFIPKDLKEEAKEYIEKD